MDAGSKYYDIDVPQPLYARKKKLVKGYIHRY